jgi:S-methylmethionine-dependent homocysteine/selenocysteine methylase
MTQTMPSFASIDAAIQLYETFRRVGMWMSMVPFDMRLSSTGTLVDAMIEGGMTKEDVIELLNCVADELASGGD